MVITFFTKYYGCNMDSCICELWTLPIVGVFLEANLLDYILMIRKLLKEQNLSECSLGICCIPECIKDFLQRNNAAGFPFICFPHNPIGAFAYKNHNNLPRWIHLPSRRLISYRSIKCDSTSFVSTILKVNCF